jgi:hypothetical protein
MLRTTALMLGLGWFITGCSDENIQRSFPFMEIEIDRIEFGAIAIGKTPSREVVIQNQGANDLVLQEPAVWENPGAAFWVAEYDQIIAPGAKGVIQIVFGPTDIKRYESTLAIKGNDPKNPSAQIHLGGDGYRMGAIEVVPLTLDFGLVNAGEAEPGKVYIRSVGTGDLVVTGIQLTPATDKDFHIQSSTRTPETLPAGTEVQITLAYRPGLESLTGPRGTLVIEADDPFQPMTEVSLTAELNQSPVADAGADQDVGALEVATLDGSQSTDPDGAIDLPLDFDWTLVRKPEGSETAIIDGETDHPSIIPDLVGVYEAELYVIDRRGLKSLLPDRTTILTVPSERMLIELVWDSPIADLDLHMLAPGGAFGGILDCFYGNKYPDWGEPGNPLDDPALKRDDLNGFGPEIIGYPEPIEGTFTFQVDFFSAHTPSGQEPTNATLRIFIDGLLRAELVKRLESQDELWNAATILWPEGTVTELED